MHGIVNVSSKLLRRLAAWRYKMTYRAVFGRRADRSPWWIHFPFEWGTPEANELQALIYQIESRLFKTFISTLKHEGIIGSVVEFGVSEGVNFERLIDCCEQTDYTCSILGFDSFEGLPSPTADDLGCWHQGDYAADFETVCRRMRLSERPHVELFKGWFADSFGRDDVQRKVGQISFARIDCDLYEPAVECLDFIADRLVDGAFLCFDDWTDDLNKGETKAFFEFRHRMRKRFRFVPQYRVSLGGMHMRVFHR